MATAASHQRHEHELIEGELSPETVRQAAVGLAASHFADVIEPLDHLPITTVHAATTILTKQLEAAICGDQPVTTCGRILLDPARHAGPHGETAADLLGMYWPRYALAAGARYATTAAHAQVVGDDRALAMSAWYGDAEQAPWWGTGLWRRACIAATGDASHVLHRLLDVPETVDAATLGRVIEYGLRLTRRGHTPPAGIPRIPFLSPAP